MVSRAFYALWQAEDGQDMVEYALLFALLALAAVSLVTGVKTPITSIWTQIGTTLATDVS